MSPAAPTTEIGNASGNAGVTSWATMSGGGDIIERVVELQWPQSVHTYGYMMNDAQIFSLVASLVWPIRNYNWFLEENGARPEITERISRNYNLPIGRDDPFNRRRGQRRFSFDKHLEDALRALVYGHMFFEQVGEVDMGAGDRLVWNLRKLGIRAPRTLNEINVESDGGLKSIRQQTGPLDKPIPVDRLVAYVWDREGANWAGRSMLRSVYRNHLVKDRILRVGAINIERAGGVPYVEAPEGASGEMIAELDALARRFRVGEAAGAALPHGAQLKFASAGGGYEAVNYIKFQNEEMGRNFLQMVNMVSESNSGLGGSGLASTMDDIANVAQETVARWFADTFNEHMIEDDVEWNEGPDEEYAPLLNFESGAVEPLEGFEMADGEDDGLMLDPEGEVAAKLGLRRRRISARRRAGSVRTGRRREQGGVSAGQASPVPLPPRPLRRQPYEHEVTAQVDFEVMDATYSRALDLVTQEVRQLQRYQAEELHDAIVAAGGNLDDLSELSVAGQGRDVIEARMRTVSDEAVTQAVAEANRQGVTVPRPDTQAIAAEVRNRAEAVDNLLARNFAQSASRQAIRLSGGGLPPSEVAAKVRDHLNGLTGAYLKDVVGGAIQQSMNAGRKLVFSRDGEVGKLYASEMLDEATCSQCIGVDGREYESLEEADRDYPTGGFMDCEGGERCRGTVVKVYSTEVGPSDEA